MSVDCPLDNYVKRILDFAKYGQGDAKELLEYNRRAVADVLERNADNLDRVLEALCSPCYTISIISVLLAKMQQPTLPTNTEKIEATLIQVENMLNIFDRESILKAIDLYIALFRRILQYFLRPECKAARGIQLFVSAIEALDLIPGRITSLHACLFCLCLKARLFDPALPYLTTHITEILNEAGNQPSMPVIEPRWILLYFYYGGLIYCSLEQFQKCYQMLRYLLCVPTTCMSAIMVEGYKKYVIVSLILYGKVPELPNCRSAIVPRSVRRLCAEYFALIRLTSPPNVPKNHCDCAEMILNYLNSNQTVFEKDGNVGLMKYAVRTFRERAILDLTKCFVCISLSDIVRRCKFSNIGHAKRYLIRMHAKGKVNMKIDEEKGIVNFDEIPVIVDTEKLDRFLERAVDMQNLIEKYDIQMRTSPSYVSRMKSSHIFSSDGGAHDDEGFQQSSPSFVSPSQNSFGILPF